MVDEESSDDGGHDVMDHENAVGRATEGEMSEFESMCTCTVLESWPEDALRWGAGNGERCTCDPVSHGCHRSVVKRIGWLPFTHYGCMIYLRLFSRLQEARGHTGAQLF